MWFRVKFSVALGLLTYVAFYYATGFPRKSPSNNIVFHVEAVYEVSVAGQTGLVVVSESGDKILLNQFTTVTIVRDPKLDKIRLELIAYRDRDGTIDYSEILLYIPSLEQLETFT